jgi:AAA family ATP:ADP antiporter
MTNAAEVEETGSSWLDNSLKLFGDVRPGEGVTAILMFLNIHVLLISFYILKTVREPLILVSGGAELKAYAAAFQALVLIAYVPLYGWFASRLPRQRLLTVVVVFFVVCIQVFILALLADLKFVGFVFFVWLGIFSVSLIAQFWSYANDIYTESEGKRLFAVIAIGATSGAPIGAATAGWLYGSGVASYIMLEIAAGLLLAHLAFYFVIAHRTTVVKEAVKESEPMSGKDGFSLVFRSRYMLLIAALLVALNIVNTTGEYILGRSILEHANALAAVTTSFDIEAYIGSFYGSFFFWVNIATFLIQAFLVSRIVKHLGMAGALFILPIIALGAYSLVALGASFAVIRIAKMAENSTDYSLMNTTKQMLWLPTSRDEKYKAKQAIDTFFVRAGDVIAAAIVFGGTTWLALGVNGFGIANMLFVLVWLGLAALLLRENRAVAANSQGPPD